LVRKALVLRESSFDTGAIKVNYGESQQGGPSFVILHGGSGSWRYHERLINLLAGSWHVYAPDFRGHGRSGHTPGHYLLADYVSDIAVFLSAVVREPAVVYGHSLGGEVAMMLASKHPELVRSVINADAPLSIEDHPGEVPEHRRMNELWHRLAGRPVDEIVPALKAMEVSWQGRSYERADQALGIDSPWFEFQAENLHQLDPDVLAAVLRGPGHLLRGYDPELILPSIRCPVLLLQADPARGSALRDPDVEKGLTLIPHAAHIKLSGLGHELQAEQVFDAIAPFLATLRPAS
jgi:pimeloyl-ACP methyl ester carboxylesterase